MTDRKFTDEDLIKALECLAGNDGPCHGCIYQKAPFPTCRELVGRQALDLINRQRAEIERLQQGEYRHIGKTLVNARNEAIEDFAERLKEIKVKYALPLLGLQTKTEIENYVDDILLQMRDGIDRLVKEMTEGKQ